MQDGRSKIMEIKKRVKERSVDERREEKSSELRWCEQGMNEKSRKYQDMRRSCRERERGAVVREEVIR
jgi:hypothetical protein